MIPGRARESLHPLSLAGAPYRDQYRKGYARTNTRDGTRAAEGYARGKG